MNFHTNIVLLRSSEIIGVVRRTLSKIDPRLVDHGERVGFIAEKIYNSCKKKPDIDFSRLVILCILHDIGAYKTNEIDDMVRFETENPIEHALYGYVFLKNTTHLAEYAEALLYHHTDYLKLEKFESRFKDYAELIYLADRADILLNSAKPDLNLLKKGSGTKFNPDYVDALLLAENRYNISEKIISGTYIKDLEQTVLELNISQTEIMDYLNLLVYAIDFRSPYTVTHTADTTMISIETGKLLGLRERDLQMLYCGAFLHDIGKIAIPHDILEKPSRLTNEEYTIVQQHIPEGEKILRGVVSNEICDIAMNHHEKMDGSGYAHGIKGDKLTLSQRIVAVSDIFSALSQKRAYKQPFPKEKVIAILNEMRDSGQLCPLVVNTACENYDLILNNTEKNQNPVNTLYQELLHEYQQRSEEFRDFAYM